MQRRSLLFSRSWRTWLLFTPRTRGVQIDHPEPGFLRASSSATSLGSTSNALAAAAFWMASASAASTTSGAEAIGSEAFDRPPGIVGLGGSVEVKSIGAPALIWVYFSVFSVRLAIRIRSSPHLRSVPVAVPAEPLQRRVFWDRLGGKKRGGGWWTTTVPNCS